MKKGTIIALIITLTYLLFATYELSSLPSGFKVSHHSIFPVWIEYSLIPGYFLGLILRLALEIGIWGIIIGQTITFFILFFILKSFINGLFFRKETLKE